MQETETIGLLLTRAILTLEGVEVRGSENMDRLLGTIRGLKEARELLTRQPARETGK